MNAHSARLSPSDRHSQFCSASQNLRRTKHRDSDSLSPYNNLGSSESTQSDDRSIFNAIRVVTPDGPSARFYASLSQENPVHEQGLAVNMARFVPTNPRDSSPVHHIHRKELKVAGKLGARTKMLSDQHWHTTHRPEPSNVTLPDSDRCLHRKTVSLGANECSHGPKWSGITHPAVIPIQPRYPPPERSPTPPGLPSFGSPEAMRYSARFLARDHGTYARANAQGPAENQRSTSYSEALRRLFGLPATPPRIDARSVTGIGRAQDGTMVLGRFPYRQSGHGTNVVRQLHDHPYHHRLPVACHEPVETAHDPFLEAARSKSAGTGLPMFSQSFNPPPRPHPLSPGSGFPFPSNLTSVVVARPQQPRARALMGLPRNLSAPEGLAGTMHADPVISSAQASRNIAGHLPSLSRLRSVRSAARASNSTRGDSIQDHPTRTTVRSTLVSWIKFQPCACCCLKELEEPDEPLGAVTSHDTYATARSQASPAASQTNDAQAASLRIWISSVYSVMFPNFVNGTTV